MRLFRAIMMLCLVATLSLGGALSHASTSQSDHGSASVVHQDAMHLDHVVSTPNVDHQTAKLGLGDQSPHSEHGDAHCCTVGACSLLLMEAPFTSSGLVLQIDVVATSDSFHSRPRELDSPPPRRIS